MAFKLSQRSLGRLDGVKNEMHSVVTYAITVSNVDFGVVCGLRTEAEQADLVARGASQTCLLYTSPSPRDGLLSRMPSSA